MIDGPDFEDMIPSPTWAEVFSGPRRAAKRFIDWLTR